jgi:hypothetical protein
MVEHNVDRGIAVFAIPDSVDFNVSHCIFHVEEEAGGVTRVPIALPGPVEIYKDELG